MTSLNYHHLPHAQWCQVYKRKHNIWQVTVRNGLQDLSHNHSGRLLNLFRLLHVIRKKTVYLRWEFPRTERRNHFIFLSFFPSFLVLRLLPLQCPASQNCALKVTCLGYKQPNWDKLILHLKVRSLCCVVSVRCIDCLYSDALNC
jgi:hypothetical protein